MSTTFRYKRYESHVSLPTLDRLSDVSIGKDAVVAQPVEVVHAAQPVEEPASEEEEEDDSEEEESDDVCSLFVVLVYLVIPNGYMSFRTTSRLSWTRKLQIVRETSGPFMEAPRRPRHTYFIS